MNIAVFHKAALIPVGEKIDCVSPLLLAVKLMPRLKSVCDLKSKFKIAMCIKCLGGTKMP